MSVDVISILDTIDGDLEIVRGDTQTWEDTVHEIENDVPDDITGATITMTVKNQFSDRYIQSMIYCKYEPAKYGTDQQTQSSDHC